jgi:hypothetical protein
MARSISVKIPTSALIEQIENRIAEIDKGIADYPAAREKFEKAQEKYEKEIIKAISTYLSKNGSKVGTDYDSPVRLSHRHYGHGHTIDLTINTDVVVGFPEKPKAPEVPNQKEHFGRDWATRKELLEKNLKILKMTTQEEVSASTYGAVMEIL